MSKNRYNVVTAAVAASERRKSGSGAATAVNVTNGGSYLDIYSYLTGYATEEWVLTQGYLPRVEFDDMFERVERADGTWYIRAKADFVGVGEIVNHADGEGSTGGSANGKAAYLHELLDVEIGIPAQGQVLMYDHAACNGIGGWVARTIQQGLDEGALAVYLASNNYAKRSDIPDVSRFVTLDYLNLQHYLTEHQDISHLLPRVEFDNMFERVERPDGSWYIRAKADFVGVGELISHANGEQSGGMLSGNATSIGGFAVELGELSAGDVLIWDGSRWTNGAGGGGGIDEAGLEQYLQGHGYITGAALSGYVTAGDLAGYATSDWAGKQFVRALYDGQSTSGDLNDWQDYQTVIGSVHALSNAPQEQGWYNVIQIAHRNGASDGPGYVGQIALGMTCQHEQMFFRTHRTRGWQQVLTHSNYAAYLNRTYVRKGGDTMTGPLSFTQTAEYTLINGTYNTAGDMTNVIWCDSFTNRVFYGSPRWSKVLLETSSNWVYRQTDGVAYKIWDEGNDGEFMRHRGNIDYSFFVGDTYANYNSGIYNCAFGGHSELLLNFALNYGSTSALQFRTNYSHDANLYFRKTIDANRFSGGWLTLISDYNIGWYNAGSASKLQTARNIYGVAWDGSSDLNGAFLWKGNDATLRIFEVTNPAQPAVYGSETLCLQSSFDQQDPETSNYPAWFPDRNVIALQPRGGRVAIGKAWAAYALDVAGGIITDGWFRSSGSTGWYNETHGGGICMNDSTYVRVSHNKALLVENNVHAIDFIGNCHNSTGNTGSSWGCGWGCFSAAIHNNGNQTPLIVAYRNGTHNSATGADRLLSMELLNDGAQFWWYMSGYLRYKFDSAGNFTAAGEIVNHSDRRLKSEIRDFATGGRLHPVTYIKDGRRQVGLIAQDVQDVCPAVVHEGSDPERLLSINYSGALCYALAGVYKEIDDHEARIRRLEKEREEREL